jgi:hypothetical protein
MGLDMYLYKRLYVQNWDHMRPEERHSITIKKGDGSDYPKRILDPSKITYIVSEAGYWRKANQIHNWFVNNVQNGTDDCSYYSVSREQLQQLLETVKEVLANPSKAQELLPTAAGFFFGSTEYDKWYYEDLELTRETLEKALEDNRSEFEYQSSW